MIHRYKQLLCFIVLQNKIIHHNESHGGCVGYYILGLLDIFKTGCFCMHVWGLIVLVVQVL